MDATIEETPDIYWHVHLNALPTTGNTLIIDGADSGTKHRVRDVTHHIGGASGHRIVIHVYRLPARGSEHG